MRSPNSGNRRPKNLSSYMTFATTLLGLVTATLVARNTYFVPTQSPQTTVEQRPAVPPTSVPEPTPLRADVYEERPVPTGACDMRHPSYVGLIGELHRRLGGEIMGDPLECQRNLPNGHVEQLTTKGLAYILPASMTVAFTNGYWHYAIAHTGMYRWVGESAERPPDAERMP